MDKIIWSKDELRKLAQYLLERNVDPTAYGFISEVRDKHQQQVLPKERQRDTLKAAVHVSKLVKMMETVRSERREAALLRKAPFEQPPEPPALAPTPAEPQPAPAPPEATEPAPPEATEPAPVSLSEVAPLVTREADTAFVHPFDAWVDSLAVHAAQRFAATFRVALKSALSTELREWEPLTEAGKIGLGDFGVKPEPRVRKPRVLILGLKPQQRAIMQHEYQHDLDLRFVEQDTNPALVKQKAGDCDLIIGMVGQHNHSYTHAAEATNVEFQRVAGGLDNLRFKLNKLRQPAQ